MCLRNRTAMECYMIDGNDPYFIKNLCRYYGVNPSRQILVCEDDILRRHKLLLRAEGVPQALSVYMLLIVLYLFEACLN